jgi:hypothetical protein
MPKAAVFARVGVLSNPASIGSLGEDSMSHHDDNYDMILANIFDFLAPPHPMYVRPRGEKTKQAALEYFGYMLMKGRSPEQLKKEPFWYYMVKELEEKVICQEKRTYLRDQHTLKTSGHSRKHVGKMSSSSNDKKLAASTTLLGLIARVKT